MMIGTKVEFGMVSGFSVTVLCVQRGATLPESGGPIPASEVMEWRVLILDERGGPPAMRTRGDGEAVSLGHVLQAAAMDAMTRNEQARRAVYVPKKP